MVPFESGDDNLPISCRDLVNAFSRVAARSRLARAQAREVVEHAGERLRQWVAGLGAAKVMQVVHKCPGLAVDSVGMQACPVGGFASMAIWRCPVDALAPRLMGATRRLKAQSLNESLVGAWRGRHRVIQHAALPPLPKPPPQPKGLSRLATMRRIACAARAGTLCGG